MFLSVYNLYFTVQSAVYPKIFEYLTKLKVNTIKRVEPRCYGNITFNWPMQFLMEFSNPINAMIFFSSFVNIFAFFGLQYYFSQTTPLSALNLLTINKMISGLNLFRKVN